MAHRARALELYFTQNPDRFEGLGFRVNRKLTPKSRSPAFRSTGPSVVSPGPREGLGFKG